MATLLTFYLVQSLQSQAAFAQPIVRATDSTIATTGWVPDPQGRGTLSIIISCALTMGLCVYSALHLNIPASGETQIQTQIRYFRWMALALFGPELIVFAAWQQYVSARTLQAKIGKPARSGKEELARATSKGTQNPASFHVQPEWSVVHGFYAGMGGFVFDVETKLASALPFPKSPPTRLTVTPRGIGLLADCGLLPTISEADIKDKSKADGTAKAIVCLQAAWMIVQVVGRVAYGLPVTLLEVNTIGHVICALSIYVLWWHKPRLIREPTPLRGDWTDSVCAYMWMSSRASDPDQGRKLPWINTPRMGELTKLAFSPQQVEKQAKSQEQVVLFDPSLENEEGTIPSASSMVAYKQDYGFLRPVEHNESRRRATDGKKTKKADQEMSLGAPPLHWHLALDAMYRFPALVKFAPSNPAEPQQQGNQFQAEELLFCEEMPNWDSTGLLSNFNGVLMGMALWFASMTFGAVHVAAWKDYFPSHTEALLWRFSASYITASGFLWLCINFLGQVSPAFDAWWEKGLSGGARRSTVVVVSFLCTICGLAYAFARVFLVIEALISLRKLPVTAYQEPDWSSLIPHL